MKILLIGSSGRMGKKVIECASENNIEILAGVDIVCGGDKFKTYKKVDDIPQSITNEVDVVLDFSLPQNTKNVLEFCKKNSKKLVICCTGHNADDLKHINESSKFIPIFITGNTSIGVYLICKILSDNKNIFKKYDIDIIEKHHKNKKDAPSGTAKMFGKCLSDDDERITYHSIRSGTIVGEHEIMLSTNYEQIYLRHVAQDRKLFAEGALKICEFIAEKNQSGLYSMEDFCCG